jgi:uncharacterized membrane protein
MPETARTALTAACLLAGTIWVGGFVAIFVVARVASATLSPADRVRFFKLFGRRYGVVGGVALLVLLGTGLALLWDLDWDGVVIATVVIGAALPVALAVGIVQARRMTRLRRAALQSPDDAHLAAQVRRGSLRAAVLRTGIGLLTLALVPLVSIIAT